MSAWNANPLERRDAGSPWASLLPRWDELSGEAVAELRADPVQRHGLELLERAEDWLQRRTAPRTPCPSAEELYDFGRGPGARDLDLERRNAIDEHLLECTSCDAFVATLSTTPPVPLDLAEPERPHGLQLVTDATVGAPAAPESSTRSLSPEWRERLRRIAPYAAAAGLLATSTVLLRQSSAPAAIAELEPAPILRGDANGPLLFPRGPVLEGSGAFARRPRFELDAQPDASEYRLVVRRHGGGAFARGREVRRGTSHEPVLQFEAPLEPGRYTWEAWAVVDGLDRELGSRDFQIVEDAQLREQIAQLDPEDAVRALHAAGFLTDARQLARRLPDSRFRSDYLSRVPER